MTTRMRLLADENIDSDIVRALVRQRPSFDIVRVQEVGLAGMDDPSVLAWAAAEGRVLVTHDVNTMPRHAYKRVARGEGMPGVIVVPQRTAVGACVEDLFLLADCSHEREWEGRVLFLPL